MTARKWPVIFAERDGRLELVGDFDALYREDPDPWGQSGAGDTELAGYYQRSRYAMVDVLKRHGRLNDVMEVGCGHGHALSEIAWAAWKSWSYYVADEPMLVGMDISTTAVERARMLHPSLDFRVGDITGDLLDVPRGTFDVVILNQVLWYVVHRMERTIANCHALLRDGGLLVVSQGFLPPGEQRYAKETWNGFHGTLRELMRYNTSLRLIEARYDDEGDHRLNDGLMVFRRA